MGFPKPYVLLLLYMEFLGLLPGAIFARATFFKSVSPRATAATYSTLNQPL